MILREREVLHLPETAHLYALLNFAQVSQARFLEPELESYLILALLRFSEMPLAGEYCLQDADYDKLKNSSELNNIEFLRDIADYCLLSSGLMAGRFSGEQCDYEQFQQVGMDAFAILSEQEENKENIYIKINRNFLSIVEILKCSQSIMHEQFTALLSGNSVNADVRDSLFSARPSGSRFVLFDNREITYH